MHRAHALSSTHVSPFTIVVLGGYGNFGTIISRALVKIPGIAVVVAGRNLQRAQTLASEIGASAARLDADAKDLAGKLEALCASMVISTAGPFQGCNYRVPEAAIAAGAHYADLADARDFVAGIGALHEAAIAQDVLVSSGASSVPALSSAVIDSLLPRFSHLNEIHHGITSSEKIPGRATVAAVLGYCGKSMRQWRGGQWLNAFGWQDLVAHDFPKPLGRRWVANCDVPDLEVFPKHYSGVQTVRFSAGVGLRVTQFGLWTLSWLVRAGILGNASTLAGLLRKAGIWLEPLGDGYSGMFVTLHGVGRDGAPHHSSWELVAANNHGPHIPCMAAVALARKLAAGKLAARGALPCVGLLSLNEYLAELDGLKIAITLSS